MPHPQYIEPPGGEQMVILPRKDYEQLCETVEDADYIRVYGEAKRRLSAGEDEMVPSEFADRILDGENPVRIWREYRGLSVKELAEKAKISMAYLAWIEGGVHEGSVSTMKALAMALNLDLTNLV